MVFFETEKVVNTLNIRDNYNKKIRMSNQNLPKLFFF